MLDLIFTNEDYMIENLRSIAPLGKSDHVGLLFTFITYSAIDTRVYGGKKHDYWKADMSEINSSLQKVKTQMGGRNGKQRGKPELEVLQI